MQRSIFRNISILLANRHFYLIGLQIDRTYLKTFPVNLNQIRCSCLVFCSEAINKNNINRNVANIGFYKGYFSKRLNIVFADIKLYLFYTFDGISSEDVQFDQKNNFSTSNQEFCNTRIEVVRSKMKHLKNCIFFKGEIPKTTKGLEEQFSFGSICAGFYLSIYERLKYFYSCLSSKGYIFIHNFNNEEYTDATEAVTQFCSEQNVGFTPIPDIGGKVIISKL